MTLDRRHLDLLIEELRRLRAAGVESVPVEEATLAGLRAAAGTDSAASASPAAGNAANRSRGARPEREENRAKGDLLAAMVREDSRSGQAAPGGKRKAAAKPAADGEIAPIPDPPEISLPEGDKQSRWDWLRDQVLGSPVCQAHVRPGKKVVFGVGNLDARIFFCGEAPGADEEVQGEPFVGRAGQLLTKIIQAMGLQREEVYIGNIMNWRPEMPTPTGNRPPTAKEMAYCLPHLIAQVQIVQPEVIVALGNTAVNGLLGPDPKRRMGRIRGTWLEFEGTPLLPTYHPSYLLRNEDNASKRKVWEDMLTVMERIGLPISEKQRNFFR